MPTGIDPGLEAPHGYDRRLVSPPNTHLRVETVLVVHELGSGACLVHPVADAALASFGPRDAALDEQRLFLSEYLADAPAETLARFSLPEAELRVVEVDLPIDRLPRRLNDVGPVAVPYVRLAVGDSSWLLVLPVGHTFYATADLDLDETVAAETKRLVGALEMTPTEWLDLLPARRHSLESIRVDVPRDEAAGGSKAAALKKRLADRERRRKAIAVLDSIGTPLHEAADARRRPPLVGRDEPLASLGALLGGDHRASVLLIGDELVGRTALLREWLRRELEAGGKDRVARRVYATSGAQLVAGMSYLGQWQERLRRVMEAAELLDAVLYFDDLADLFGDRAAGARSEVDLPGAMKRFLDDGRVRIVGEVSAEAIDSLESRHVGFFGAFHRLKLEPQTPTQTRETLERRIAWSAERESDRPRVETGVVDLVVELLERYEPYRPFPGKAVRFLDELVAAAEATPGWVPGETIGEQQVYEALSLRSGLPLFLLREDRPLRAEQVTAELRKRVVGQEWAVQGVVDTICTVKAQLMPADKPLGTFLFVGPTGVGKTELARALAAFLFGSGERLARFDMSEYADAYAADRLIRGSERDEGLLTRQVRRTPFSVLLLDEIEKAHPAVFDLLLQVAGEGRLTDARGQTAFFHNAMIIMTSNLGTTGSAASIGLGADTGVAADHYVKAVEAAFRPEFINRIDRIVPFRPLDRREVRDVARLIVEAARQRRGLVDLGVEIDVSDEALDRIADQGYSERYGARALRRHVEDGLAAPAAGLLSALGRHATGVLVRVRPEGGEAERGLMECTSQGLRLTIHQGTSSARPDLEVLRDIGTWRRRMRRYLELDSVVDARERQKFLLAQLSYGQKRRGDPPPDIAPLQREHHALQEVWSAAAEHLRDLESIEEIALSALFEGEDATAVVDDADQAHQACQAALLPLIVAREPSPHGIAFVLRELDKTRLGNSWVPSFRALAERKRWRLSFHLHRGAYTKPDWPRESPWGSEVPDDVLDTWLAKADRSPLKLLVRVSGGHAGILLATETGLHRYLRLEQRPGETKSGDMGHLLVQRLARSETLTQAQWKDPKVMGLPAPAPDQLRLLPAVRQLDASKRTCRILDDVALEGVSSTDYFDSFDRIVLEHLLLLELEPHLDREQLAGGLLVEDAE